MKNNLGRQILIGLSAGILVGIFLGEYAEPFGYIGDAFIGLMQMTVLPYIMVSLLANLGKLNIAKTKPLLYSGILVQLGYMLIGIGMIQLLPVFFPAFETASFFSTSLIQPREPLNLIDIYIPSNLFGSMAANTVPAVVLFSIIVGISLNLVPGNDGLVRAFDVMAEALNKANKIIVKLTPIGLFGIAAHTTGMMAFSQLSLLQVYIVVYGLAATLMVLLLLPLIVSAVTPFSYKDILRVPKNTLITIFATSKIVILLPQLIENLKELFEKYGQRDEETDSSAELILPLAYPFPNLGTMVIMVFVPFAAWFVGKSLGFNEQVQFIGSALLSSFVAPITGIPFLLDSLKLPDDTFQLFVVSTVITDRIRVVLGAMHLFTLSVLAIAYSKGLLQLNWLKLLRAGVVGLGAIVILLFPLKHWMAKSFAKAQNQYQSFVEMDMISKRVEEVDRPSINSVTTSVTDIVERGYLRVGYQRDALPYVFNNIDGLKVGYDVELMNILASDLEVPIQWVEVPRGEVSGYMNVGAADIFVSGMPTLLDDIGKLEFTDPYTEHTFAFITHDYNREDFKSLAQILKNPGLKIAIPGSRYLFTRLSQDLEGSEIALIDTPREFFQDSIRYDAMIFSAEAGSAWTIIYPSYSVVLPEGRPIQAPVAMALAEGSLELTQFLNSWLQINKHDGTLDRLYHFWILGEGSQLEERHWSVIKDVFHWVD